MKRTHPVGITHVLQVQKETQLVDQSNYRTVQNVLLENGVLQDQQAKEIVHMDSFARLVKKLASAKNVLLGLMQRETI